MGEPASSSPSVHAFIFEVNGGGCHPPHALTKKNTQHVLSIGKQRVIYNFSDSGYCGG